LVYRRMVEGRGWHADSNDDLGEAGRPQERDVSSRIPQPSHARPPRRRAPSRAGEDRRAPARPPAGPRGRCGLAGRAGPGRRRAGM